jgi:hypothetical protein
MIKFKNNISHLVQHLTVDYQNSKDCPQVKFLHENFKIFTTDYLLISPAFSLPLVQ